MYSTPTFFPGSTSELPSPKPSASFLAAQARLGQSLLLLPLQAFLFHLWGPFQRVGEGTASVWALVLQENLSPTPLPPSPRLAVLLGAHALHGLVMHCSFLQGAFTTCSGIGCHGVSAQKWPPGPAGENLLPHGPFRRLQDTCCCSALASVGLFFIFSPSRLSLTAALQCFLLLNVTTAVLPALLMGSALASRGEVGA